MIIMRAHDDFFFFSVKNLFSDTRTKSTQKYLAQYQFVRFPIMSAIDTWTLTSLSIAVEKEYQQK